MKRFLLFFSVLFGTALVIFLLVIGTNWQSYVTLFSNQEGLVEGSEWIEKTYSLEGLTQYIGQNPERVSVVSYRLEAPGEGIYFQADEPRVMGAISNFFLIIEYAKRVQAGRIDSAERVPLSEFEKYRLPKIDDGAHEDAIATLEKENKIDDQSRISLQDAIEVVAEFNPTAFADFFYYRFGKSEIDSLQSKLSLEHTQPVLPYLGLHLATFDKIQGESSDTLLAKYQAMERAEFGEFVRSEAESFLADSSYSSEARRIFREEGLQVIFTEQRDFHQLFPKSTARELTQIMEQLYKKHLISEGVSKLVLEILDWPLQERQMRDNFNDYAAIYDNRMGVLSGLDAGVSAYTDNSYVQAVLFDSLQVGFWVHMSSNHMHQDYQQRLIWDPALQEVTRKATSGKMIPAGSSDELEQNGNL